MTISYRNGLDATLALLEFSLLKREVVRTTMLAVVLLFVGSGVAAAQTGSGEKLKVALFGFELVNTSLQPTTRQIEWAREAGADLAVWGTVQKVSNLILNENVYIDDARSGSRYFSQSVDIRGNTDESWVRGMRYLLRYILLEKR